MQVFVFLYSLCYNIIGSTLERIKSATGIPQLEAVQCRLAW